jgi:hypothetical protein
MEKFIIGYVDTNPDTGEDYPFYTICECDSEYMCNWIVSTLRRDLKEHSDEPNRRIEIKNC